MAISVAANLDAKQVSTISPFTTDLYTIWLINSIAFVPIPSWRQRERASSARNFRSLDCAPYSDYFQALHTMD
jgi:hypothetical protein